MISACPNTPHARKEAPDHLLNAIMQSESMDTLPPPGSVLASSHSDSLCKTYDILVQFLSFLLCHPQDSHLRLVTAVSPPRSSEGPVPSFCSVHHCCFCLPASSSFSSSNINNNSNNKLRVFAGRLPTAPPAHRRRRYVQSSLIHHVDSGASSFAVAFCITSPLTPQPMITVSTIFIPPS